MSNAATRKPSTVLFLLGTGAEEENMRLISQCLLRHDASYQVQGLALEPRAFADNMAISNIADYPGQSPVQILGTIKPSIIATGDDAGIPYRAFVEAARFLGIPSLLITSGIIVGNLPFSPKNLEGGLWLATNLRSTAKRYRLLWSSLRDCQKSIYESAWFIMKDLWGKFYHTNLYGHSGCSRIAVAGDYIREQFIQKGIPSDRIVVTGIPRFDNIWNRTFDNSAFRRQFGLARDKSVVSLLTDAQVEHRLWTVGRRRDFISKLLSACQEIPEVQFVIKVHPYEDPTDYQQAVKKLGLEIPVSKEIPLYDLINASDAVMTGISTTGMETLIFNKPLLILNLYRQPEYIPYVSQGVALGIHDAGDIPECIRAALDDQPTKDRLASNRAGFLHQHLYLQDGKASERVADLIRQMVKRPFEPPQN